MSVWTVVGATSDIDTYFCNHICCRFAKAVPGNTVKFQTMLEVDFLDYMTQIRLKKGGPYHTCKDLYVVERDGVYVGGLMTLVDIAVNEFGMEDAEIANTMMFEKTGIAETKKFLDARKHGAVHISFTAAEAVGKEDPLEYGKLVIELFDELAPKAVENFKALCTGENAKSKSYVECPIHRIVAGGWFQCGDVVDGSGKHSEAVVGDGARFEDESYSVDFGAKYGGIVGYSTSEPHTNGSQFFVTNGPCKWMNNSFVGFGRVIQGFSTLKEINKAKTTNERPTIGIKVSAAGVY